MKLLIASIAIAASCAKANDELNLRGAIESIATSDHGEVFLESHSDGMYTHKSVVKHVKIEDVSTSDAAISFDDTEGNFIDAGEMEWMPGDEAEPLSHEEIDEIMSQLSSNHVFKDMSTRPGKGLGRNNLKALINSGKPFLLNGLDDDLRAGLEEEVKLRLEDKNQPYLIVVPEREKGNQINFHYIEAAAPQYELIKEGTASEKKRNFLRSFLEMAHHAHNDVDANRSALKLDDMGNGRKLEGTEPIARPTRQYVHTAGPFEWHDTDDPSHKISTYWETAYLDYYLTSRGHDIHVIHRGNVNSNYIWDDRNSVRGFANGHSTHELTPPSGYFIQEFEPKNVNNEIQVSATTGFELSGTAECGAECGGGVTAKYSESETIQYSIHEWEILANGYGQWDFKQVSPFTAWGESPMCGGCGCGFMAGHCIRDLPALSRGTLDYKTAALLTGSDTENNTGWQWVAFKTTARSFEYHDEGLYDWRTRRWTRTAETGYWVYVG